MPIFICKKYSKIIGKSGVYKFTGGVYETNEANEAAELKTHNDVKEAPKVLSDNPAKKHENK